MRKSSYENRSAPGGQVKSGEPLAKQVKKEDYRTIVLDHVTEVVKRLNGEDLYIFSASLLELLLEERHAGVSEFATLAEKLAVRSEPRELFDQAKRYWKIAASCYRASDPDKARQADLSAAETYIKDAESRIKHEFLGCYGSASDLLLRAIEAYNKIEDTEEIVAEIKRTLRFYQKKSTGELISFNVERPDFSEVFKRSEARVANLSLQDALIALALITRPSNAKEALSRTEERLSSGDDMLHFLLENVYINSSGATVARSTNLDPTKSEHFEQAVLEQAYHDASHLWIMNVHACIEPARMRLLVDHYDISWKDFLDLVTDNPMVPSGREVLFARGLFYGMTGDFLLATHLLIPQLENSIRHLLTKLGLESFKIVKNRIQEERGLTVTLVEQPYVGELEKCLGENILFDLRGLLVDRHGLNLRNEMAHGLIGINSFYSFGPRYLWWMTLHLCTLALHATRVSATAPPEKEKGFHRADGEDL